MGSAWLKLHSIASGLSLVSNRGENGCYLESPLSPFHGWKEHASVLVDLLGFQELFLSHFEIAEQFWY